MESSIFISFLKHFFRKEIIQKLSGSNLLLSPPSILTALAMAFAGAHNDTAKNFVDVLQFQNTPSFHQQMNDCLSSLKNNSSFSLASANAVWVKDSYLSSMKAEFLEVLKQHYQAEIKGQNFVDGAQSAAVINEWVKTQTQNHIPTIVSSDMFDELTRLVLVSALYFKGTWEKEFKADSTSPQHFHRADGKQMKAPTMFMKHKFKYLRNETFEWVNLPYHGDLSMSIVLPQKGINIDTFLESFDFHLLLPSERISKVEMELFLPKFKFEYELNMKEQLFAMGLTEPFGRSANFAQMHPEGQHWSIDKVIHKTTVEVEEKGTVATAATAVTCRLRSAPMPKLPPLVLRVDRPFLFAIQTSANIPLFVGVTKDPLQH
eukprot:GCRY01001370.1.p1 GENE.GCRY01001370.1~~GCRY01001370.1.p1  ORF type:complete len:375 (-),score=81.88 GCRY01001370.1:290-1414(-)